MLVRSLKKLEEDGGLDATLEHVGTSYGYEWRITRIGGEFKKKENS